MSHTTPGVFVPVKGHELYSINTHGLILDKTENPVKSWIAESGTYKGKPMVSLYNGKRNHSFSVETLIKWSFSPEYNDLEGESFIDIPGYTGYKASTLGRIKYVAAKNGIHRIIFGVIHDGYYRIGIIRNSINTREFIHRIVALAFHENPLNLEYVNHKNGIKTDNRPVNIEWCSPSQNIKHAYRIGLVKPHGEKNYSAKLTWDNVKYIRESISARTHSITELSSYFGVKPKQISRIISNTAWKI